jgi:hypothetical protein
MKNFSTPKEFEIELFLLLGNGPNLAKRAADAFGVSEHAVRKWINGTRPVPKHILCHLDCRMLIPKIARPDRWAPEWKTVRSPA